MQYSRIDINLLPPELRPGPVVRYRVIINALMIIVTVAFLILDAVVGITRVGTLRSTLLNREADVKNSQHVVREYDQLMNVNNYVERTGRLISLASADYTDLPVVLHRVATILPDGVFLEKITNSRASKESTQTNVIVSLVASRDDLNLVLDTLERFKADPMLGNCFMRMADTGEVPLRQLLETTDITWSVSGPDLDQATTTLQIKFEIYSMVEAPLIQSDLEVTYDDGRFLKTFERIFEESQEAGKANASSSPGSRVINAPPGVTVKEVQ